MHRQLPAPIEEKLRGLCRKIFVGENLDEEVQAELYGHLEDKYLAYMQGEEQITEDDAFILLREHFGDPKVVRGMLCDVHRQEADCSLARKFAALLVLGAIVSGIGRLVTLSLAFSPFPVLEHRYSTLFGFVLMVFYIAVYVHVLRGWRKRMDQGETLWFQSMRPRLLCYTVLVAYLISQAFPALGFVPELSEPVSFSPVSWYIVGAVSYLLGTCIVCVILWWFDLRSGKERLFLLASMLFLTTSVASLGSCLLPRVVCVLTQEVSASNAYSLVVPTLNAYHCQISLNGPIILEYQSWWNAQSIAANQLITLAFILAATAIYGLGRWAMHKRGKDTTAFVD
jgi:hypothetical protein